MSDAVFVDTNVLVYLRDPSDAEKQRRSSAWFAALWERGTGRISWQVLQEFYLVMTRKLDPPADPARVREDMDALATWAPITTEQGVVASAWRIEDRYGFSWWDALVVAQALESGASTLLTEDLQHGREVEGLRIVSPFEVRPDAVDS